MRYLLDTNVCTRHLNQRSPEITQRLSNTSEYDIAVCSVVKAELYYGALRSQQPARTLERQQFFLDRFVSLPFDDLCIMTYASVRATLASSGQLIGPNDLMIAAIALTHDLTLVTLNTREFTRIVDLKLEDWERNA